MIHNREVVCSVEAEAYGKTTFTGILKLGTDDKGQFIVDAYTTPKVAPGEPRGSYFTVIPISPTEYRRSHPTRTGFLRENGAITVFSDWGHPYRIECDDPSVLDELEHDCVAANILPRRSE